MAATADVSLKIDTGNVLYYPVKASTTIYQHTFVGDDGSGYARGLVAGDPFRGLAKVQADNSAGAAAAINVEVYDRIKVQLAISGLAITDVGKDVYASDDQTATLTSTSNSYIGKVIKYLSSGVGIVELQTVNADVVNHQHTAGTDGGPLTSPRVVTSINDANGAELIKLTATGTAVNEITLANAATGNGPSITASGETNVDLTVAAKGTGTLTLGQATGEVAIATAAGDKIGLYGTTPAAQPAHIADPASAAAITAAVLTDNGGGQAADGTIADIASADASETCDRSVIADAVKELSDQINKLVADVTAVRTASEANNTAIDSINAALAVLGITAAS